MAPDSSYFIEGDSTGRASAQLYAQYRAQLDRETFSRRRGGVIEVRPTRVALEGDASPAPSDAGRLGSGGAIAAPARGAGTSEAHEISSRISLHGLDLEYELQIASTPFRYETPSAAGEIALTLPPAARGLLVDLLA